MCFDIKCLFGCMTICGCKDAVTRKLVFFPPPPTYKVTFQNGGQGSRNIPSDQIHLLSGQDSKRSGKISVAPKLAPDPDGTFWLRTVMGELVMPRMAPDCSFYFLKTRRNKIIGSFYAECSGAKATILFAHGNATDLGLMREGLLDLRAALKVNIFAFEYTGYGISTGRPTERDTLADIDAAYDFLINKLRVDPGHIIAYGQSLGSGPVIHLASRNRQNRKRQIAGIVLHSPLLSGLRVVQHVQSTPFYDIYPNIDLIRELDLPVFIMHGLSDADIDVYHGKALESACKRPWKGWFPEGGTHNNLEETFRPEYLRRLAGFIRYLNLRQDST